MEQKFIKHWQNNLLTLHGFRRFKTTHLLNLHFLEDEITELDHVIYQAGLTLDRDPSSPDRLGLQHSKRDKAVPPIEESITQETILRSRVLLKEYDSALIVFNKVMAMETFSLLDDEKQSSMRPDLSLYEKYIMQLVRTDLGTRTRIDPFQRRLHKHLRTFRYWQLSKTQQENPEAAGSAQVRTRWSHQNMIAIADIIGRAIAVVMISVLIIIPLAFLPSEEYADDCHFHLNTGLCPFTNGSVQGVEHGNEGGHCGLNI
ncbi:hypothetical protein F5Y16DRAFT_406684 [Xylariaceae sp. FL0255]|nr:hypothetical protein F5Y16DRAFT_406684 [Xylariaceae sp. FL0255]